MMRNLATLGVLLFLVAATASAAEDGQERKQGPAISEWLKSMQRKIESIVPKKSLSTSTGVAGVRGAKEDQQVKLYWKGKAVEESVTEDELKEFQEGIDLASKGDRAGAVRELEEFMKLYPNSPLIPDAKKTLDLVKQEPESKPAAEKKEERPVAQAKEPAKETGATAAP